MSDAWDLFAAAALQGMLGHPDNYGNPEFFAGMAAKYADAMMAERAKRQPAADALPEGWRVTEVRRGLHSVAWRNSSQGGTWSAFAKGGTISNGHPTMHAAIAAADAMLRAAGE